MKTKTMKLKGLSLLVMMLAMSAILVNCSKMKDEMPTLEKEMPYKFINIDNTGNNCTQIFAGQWTEVGSVCLVDDIDNGILNVTYEVTGGWEITEIHFAVGNTSSAIPQTKKGNLIPGQFPYSYSFPGGITTYSFTIPLSNFGFVSCDDGNTFYAAAHCAVRLPDGNGGYQTETGWGNGSITPGNSWGEIFTFKVECDNGGGDGEGNGETAFAYGCENATCFLDIPDENFHRWGWTNGPLVDFGTYYFPIYAAAGQCDLTKGTLVGQLIVEYDGTTAIVTYTTCGDYTLDETHLYVGCDILAMNNGEYTVAPGQYGNLHENIPAGTQTDSYTITGLDCIDGIYVVAHAVVVGDYTMGGCGDPDCDFVPFTPPCNEWIVYGSNLNGGSDVFDDAIYAYDLNAQTQTLVYDPGFIDSDQNYPNANAYDPDNQRIYFGTDDGRLYYHQIGSGTHVQVEGNATSGSFGNMACGAWYNGKFYYVQNGTNKLYEVTIVSDVATRTQIGTVPTSNGYGDIAFDPANPGVFVGSAGTSWYWYNINNNTSSSLTRLGDNPGNHLQLAYGSNGVLYGVLATSGVWYTVTYDATTVTTTLLGWDSPYTFTDLASGPQCQ